jgi:hypothetical protein
MFGYLAKRSSNTVKTSELVERIFGFGGLGSWKNPVVSSTVDILPIEANPNNRNMDMIDNENGFSLCMDLRTNYILLLKNLFMFL